MNEFDLKASEWDFNPMHIARSEAVVKHILKKIPVQSWMTALEFGAGTGITGFLLKDHLKEITMIDSSSEMIRIINEKIKAKGAGNLKSLWFDLEKNDFTGEKFNLVISQMVLHHVHDIENIIRKFRYILYTGGYIAIADLYPEDGSFHGSGFEGHKGFDVKELSQLIGKLGFKNIDHEKCFAIDKKISDTETKIFDVFLLTAEGD
jgi:ubiquinone/menaquinone biosynthesis C-methylase UbiE